MRELWAHGSIPRTPGLRPDHDAPMGLFSRRRRPAPAAGWQPPERPHCSCARHLDDELLRTSVPLAGYVADEGLESPSVADLVEWGALAADPTTEIHQRLPDSGVLFTWTLWVGDEARSHYDDERRLGWDAQDHRYQGD